MEITWGSVLEPREVSRWLLGKHHASIAGSVPKDWHPLRHIPLLSRGVSAKPPETDPEEPAECLPLAHVRE